MARVRFFHVKNVLNGSLLEPWKVFVREKVLLIAIQEPQSML